MELGSAVTVEPHRVDATTYLMHWVDVQSLSLGLFALGAYVNGPTYTAKGLELQLLARVTEGLTRQGARPPLRGGRAQFASTVLTTTRV
jgi:hypothetical protein